MGARAALGQMGADLRCRDRAQVRQALGFPAMLRDEGQVQPTDMAIGLQRPGRQPTLMGQVFQPG